MLEYADAILDFKLATAEQQREFADVVTRSLDRSSDETSPCHPLVNGALRRRVDALLDAMASQRSGIYLVKRLLRTTLCAHCLLPRVGRAVAEEQHRLNRDAVALGARAVQLANIAQVLDDGDMLSWRQAREDGLASCVPAPFVVALSGPEFPRQDWRQVEHGVRYPFARDAALVRTWHTWTDRFALVLSRLPAKLGYQMKVITSCFEASHMGGAQRAVFWAQDTFIDPEVEVGEAPVWRWPNHPTERSLMPATRGAASALALVVHISNLTAASLVDAAWEQAALLADASEGLDILFVEDSLRQPWETNVRPVHAGILAQRCRSWRRQQQRDQRPTCGPRSELGSDTDGQHDGLRSTIDIIWHRHQATLGHEDVSYITLRPMLNESGVVVFDLRGSNPSSNEAATVVAGRGLGDEFDLLAAFRRQATFDFPMPSRRASKTSGFDFFPAIEVRNRLESLFSDGWHPWVADATKSPTACSHDLGSFLGSYVSQHRDAARRWRSVKQGAQGPRSLVYVCNPFSLCGGHGDRTNGIISAFALAVLTDRAFFIDSDSPLPLNLLLQPRRGADGKLLVDWRLRGGAVGVTGQAFYLDDRVVFQEDLAWLVRDPSPVLLVSMNLRELQAILSHPLLLARVQALGLRQKSHLVSQLWDLLFEPTPVLRDRLEAAAEELQLRGPLPWRPWLGEAGEASKASEASEELGFIAVHFRAGNESARLWWDPGRHPLSSLPGFLECAALVETELGLPSNTQWFLSADTSAALTSEPAVELRRRGKLVSLGEDWRLAHVDRSHVSLGLQGFADSYVAYVLLASARAVVLSRSYFGETAAEVGAVPSAYFAEGCVRTSLFGS